MATTVELEKIASAYTPPTIENKQKDNTNRKRRNTPRHFTQTPHNLFDILPFAGIDLTDDTEEDKPYVCIN